MAAVVDKIESENSEVLDQREEEEVDDLEESNNSSTAKKKKKKKKKKKGMCEFVSIIVGTFPYRQ